MLRYISYRHKGINLIYYRLFLSAEPAADPAYHIIPQGILESAIKITNEPPSGMWANLHKVIVFGFIFYVNLLFELVNDFMHVIYLELLLDNYNDI